MKVTKQEVKTIYTIEITLRDFIDALMAYSKDEFDRAIHKGAFKHLNANDVEDEKLANIKKYFKSFKNDDEVATKDYVVNFLGFDGVVNYGLYKEKTDTISMLVFNYGDQINK